MARLKNGLRWAAVLPASVIGCLLARSAMLFIYGITSYRYVDPDSFLSKRLIEWFGMFVMGAAAVYIGWFTAPNNKRVTAVVVAGLVLFASGALMFTALIYRNLWGAFEIICLNIGSTV